MASVHVASATDLAADADGIGVEAPPALTAAAATE